MSGEGNPRSPNFEPSGRDARQAAFRRRSPVTQDINVLALVKGEERYIFLYDDEHRSEALRTLGKFASNAELSFSWYDAAVLSQRIRQTALEQQAEAAAPALSHRRFKLPLASEE
jgi:hypothetical protein